jgi:tetratricopeptide (TPR) repeat protein
VVATPEGGCQPCYHARVSDEPIDETLLAGVGATLPADVADDATVPAGVAATVASMRTARGLGFGAPMELPRVEASSYELREQLGAGGMGKVVVARDRRLGRLLAIKVAQTADPSLRTRFTREAVLTARLQHPSIIPVHEAGIWLGDEPFYAMKLVVGSSLARLIARAQSLDERLALVPNVIAVVDALAYAHAQRVIHRDLKPDNVIVGEFGETIVIDWGLAKELDADEPDEHHATPYRKVDAGQTVEGAAMGTPPYMAPEQAAGERVDERADVYGLGAMLYHVLSGEAPYQGKSANEVMDQVLAGPPIALATRQAGIPEDLLAIVDKAMARAPADRYANAKFLADDLKRFVGGQLVAAHVYSRRELLRRWLVKHRVLLGVVAAATVLIGLAIGLWARAELRDRAARQERVAELAHADDTDEATARAQLGGGAFAAAAETLARQVEHLAGKDELRARHDLRAVELGHAQRIAEFYEHGHRGIFLTGDEDRGEQAIYEIVTALSAIGALDGDRFVPGTWWENLFPDQLTAAQRRDMQQQAYRLVLALGFLHFKQGSLLLKLKLLTIAKSPAAAAHFRTSLDVLGQTTGLEHALQIRPARVRRVWERMAVFLLARVGTAADAAAAIPVADVEVGAENADDHGLLGAGQFLVWENRDTPLGAATRMTFPDLFDYDHPLETAERELRIAIRVDPHLYWPHFMLGLTLRGRGDLGGAELAFDECVMLEPSFLLGYGARAQALAARAVQESDPRLRDELMTRALADSGETLVREPDHPVTYWVRGDLMRALGKRADAIAAYTRALELEDDVLGKFSRQTAIRTLSAYVADGISPDDADGLALLALAAVASHDPAVALERANQSLAAKPDHSLALAVRGTAYLQLDKLDLALADLVRAPGSPLAALGRARILERTAGPDKALGAYDALLRVAVVHEHRLQAQLGRYRALTVLGRTADADAALHAAKEINPARRLP